LIFTRFDILLSNDLDSLPANYLVSRIRKKKLVYDSHEYFTEVPELINRPRVQTVWERIEKSILPNLKNNYTVGQRIADVYNKKYGIEMSVIRNFPTKKVINREKEISPKVVLYQGALNVGRGLEELIESFKFIEGAKLQIAGSGDIESKLKLLTKELGLDKKVKFLGRLNIEDLHSLTSNASLGVSLEKEMGLSYKYAIPNKIFDYIQAGVPVLYSPLVEVIDLLNSYTIGEHLKSHNPKDIGQQISRMLNSLEYEYWESECLRASEVFNWRNEEIKLLKIFEHIA
jgi:glycosyltransferase involved in cell wall biosynthesis